MGDKEPRASSRFFLGNTIGGYWLGQDRDTAGAGAGGEVARVVIEDVQEGDDGRVHRALG